MACTIAIALKIFKVTCGLDAITTYTSYIFTNSGSGIDPHTGVIVLNIVQVFFSIMQSFAVDRLGRKFLLIVTEIAMVFCLTLMGVTIMLKDRELIDQENFYYLDYLPLVSLTIFSVAFPVGLASIPWIMLGEIFPQEIKSVAASLATFVSWTTSFTVTKLFIVIDTSWGGDIAFYLFAAFTTGALLFTVLVVPETKNKSFDEIQRMLSK